MSGSGSSGDLENTADTKALAEFAALRYDTYKDIWEPLQSNLWDAVAYDESEAAQELVTGRAATDVNAQTSQALTDTAKSMGQSFNPASGAFGSAMNEVSEAAGTTKAAAMTGAEVGLNNKTLEDMQNIVSLGEGEASTTTTGLSSLASNSTSTAMSDSTSDYNASTAGLNALGTVAGMYSQYQLSE